MKHLIKMTIVVILETNGLSVSVMLMCNQVLEFLFLSWRSVGNNCFRKNMVPRTPLIIYALAMSSLGV